MTYRERKERRAEQRAEWAAKREAKAEAGFNRAHELASMIPLGQPILVGHHSERGHRRHIAKIEAAGFGAVADSKMADKHARTASEIEYQLSVSIYDDDPDAIERLKAKLAAQEAKREAIKAENVARRKRGEASAPAYVLQNLGGNIKRTRDRIARLEAQKAPEYQERGRYLTLRWGDVCRKCERTMQPGDQALYFKKARALECYPHCPGGPIEPTPEPTPASQPERLEDYGTVNELAGLLPGQTPGYPHSLDEAQAIVAERDTVKRPDLFGNVTDTYATEAELNGWKPSQGKLI